MALTAARLNKRLRYQTHMPGDEPDALGAAVMNTMVRQDRVERASPSQAEVDAVQTTEICLAISNPALYGKSVRWRDPFTSDKTAVYCTFDKPVSGASWPQVAASYTQYLTGGPAAGVIPSRNNINQLTNFNYLTSLRRTIRENKNPSGYYNTMEWYSTNGTRDFVVAGSGDQNTSVTQTVPGGAFYNPTAAGLYQQAMVVATGGLGALGLANAGNVIPSSGFSPMHGQYLPAMTHGGRYFIYNDGYSGANGTTQTLLAPVPNAGAPPANNPISGFWVDSTMSAGSRGDPGQWQKGGLAVLQGTIPLPLGQHFDITVWRYNAKNPQVYTTGSGSVGGGGNIVNYALFTCNITIPDYYAIELTVTNDPTTANQGLGLFNYRVMQVNTGEFWCHVMTPFFNIQNFGSVVASRCFGTTLLCSNVTPAQYLAGTFAGAQPPASTEWIQVVNGTQATDPYTYVIDTLGEKNKDLKNGAFIFTRPTSQKQMDYQGSIIVIQGSSGQGFAFAEPLADQPFSVIVLNSPGGVYVQNIQFEYWSNGEYLTRNQFIETQSSRFTPEQWTLAMQLLSSMDQVYENHTHSWEILKNIGTKVGIPKHIMDAVVHWAPKVVSFGKQAFDALSPLLPLLAAL